MAAVLVAPSGAQEKAPLPRTLDALKAAVQRTLDQYHVPGAGLALVRKDAVEWAGGVGSADLQSGAPVTADTHFRVGSVSKTFVAMALVQLAEEGRLNLDARVADLAPELRIENRFADTHPLRVAHLLEHTAGFDDMHFNETYNLGRSPDISLQQVLAINPRSRVVRWAPGTRMAYSNPGYGVAGNLIEKIAGEPYDRVIEQRIFAPLGMATSSFRLDDRARAALSKGYQDASREPVPLHQIYLRPAGNLHTSPRELATFVRVLLNRGSLGGARIVRPESLARMETPGTSVAARAGLRHGYGLAIFSTIATRIKVYGHDGGIEGFTSSYAYSPAAGIGYVVLLNSAISRDARRTISDLALAYLTRDLTPAPKPRLAVPAADLQRVAGHYRDANPRNQLMAFMDQLFGGRRVFVEDGKLYEKPLLGDRRELIPVTRSSFRLENEVEASRVFVASGEVGKVMAGGGLYLERVNPWPVRILFWALAASALLMGSAALFALVWIPRRLFGRMKGVERLSVRAVPLAAVAALVAGPFVLRRSPMLQWGTANVYTVAFFILTLVFPMLSALGLVLALRSRAANVRRGVRAHALLVSAANCVVALYLAWWGVIGLRTWAY